MKILVATPLYPPEIGGPATYATLIEREFPARGVEVSVEAYSSVRHLPKGISHFAYLIQVFQRAYGHDALYILDPSPSMFPAALAALLRGKPYVLKIVGDIAWEQGRQRFGITETLDGFVTRAPSTLPLAVRIIRALEIWSALRAKRIIVPSEYLKRIVTAWGVPAAKIDVVYNAFDGVVSPLPREEARKKFGITGTMLLSAGRLVPWKGFSALIGIMQTLREEFPDLTLAIAGSGPDEGELWKEISKNSAEAYVRLLGNVAHDELAAYVRAADCFVLNTGYEGLSHQILEVMAAGTPIVTTPVGGNPELIRDGESGLLASHDDKAALIAAISRILRDPALAAGLSSAARSRAGEFTIERAIAGALRVIQGAVE